MKIVGNLLSGLTKGATGLVQSLSGGRIALWGCVLLLGSTTLLAYLLKRSYEAQGALEVKLEVVQTEVKQLEKDAKDRKRSCEVTDAIVAGNVQSKRVTDKATKDMIKRVEGVLNEKLEKGLDSPDGNGGALLRLLELSTCQAKNNGIPCATGDTAPPM